RATAASVARRRSTSSPSCAGSRYRPARTRIRSDLWPRARACVYERCMQNLRIDAERLWGELMETAAIGGTAKGGICPLTLTDLDRQVREWFSARAEALGCTVTVDDMGAMFARRPG